LVNNYQQLFNNFICPQIAQIKQIFFVGQQLSTIIQKFYLSTDYTDFLFVNNYQQLSTIFICPQITQITQIFYWSTIIKNYPKIFICPQIAQITQIFLLVNNYQQLSTIFICPQIAQITQIFCWSKITQNYPKICIDGYERRQGKKRDRDVRNGNEMGTEMNPE